MAWIVGTPGADTLEGGAADDLIEGGGGHDRITGGSGRDTLLGGGGRDIIDAHIAAAFVDGGEGDDFISLRALAAGETLAPGAVFRGGAGDDDVSLSHVAAATSGLVLDGGEGRDSLVIFGSESGNPPALELRLDGSSPGATVTVRGFESVELAPAARIYGSSVAETIATGRERDFVDGGGGDDIVTSDPVQYGIDGRPVYIGAADTLLGGAGNDTISDFTGSNYLRGGDGDDRLRGGIEFDDLHGNVGADTVSGGEGDDWVVGGKDNDVLSGDLGADIVYGNLGDDTCDGGLGDDIVRGGQDNDVVNGGAGDDYVSGDRGDDTVSGGEGSDRFHTFGDAGLDRVLDFSVAEGDRVQLDPGTAYAAAQVGADTVITMAGGGQMVLVGVSMSSLPNGWIFGA